MTERNTERTRIVMAMFATLLMVWNIFDASGPAPRYLAAAATAGFTFTAVWLILRYRQRFPRAR
jgi:hypothetical protein